MVEICIIVVSSSASAPFTRLVQSTVMPRARRVEEAKRGVRRGHLPTRLGQRRDRIDDEHRRTLRVEQAAQVHEVLLRAARFGAHGVDLQQAGGAGGAEIDPHRAQVARDLTAALVEADEQRPLAPRARRGDERAGERRLRRAGSAGDQRDRFTEVAAAEHRVEPRQAARDPLVRGLARQRGGREGADVDPVGADDHRKLPLGERRAAVLEQPQGAQRHPIDEPVLEHDDAIDHELEEGVALRAQPVTGVGLRGDHRGQVSPMQPFLDAIHLASFGDGIAEHREQDVEPVENDPSRAHGFDLRVEGGEHRHEVERSVPDDGRGKLGVEKEELLPLQRGEVPAEGGGVGDDLARVLLEGDEDRRLVVVAGAVHQRLEREDRLAGTRSADDERRATARQTAVRDLVEPRDPGLRLLDRAALHARSVARHYRVRGNRWVVAGCGHPSFARRSEMCGNTPRRPASIAVSRERAIRSRGRGLDEHPTARRQPAPSARGDKSTLCATATRARLASAPAQLPS
jgi:hypothetical protein